MADGVFGIAVDNTTLKGMRDYSGKIIRRSDRAKVARDRMSDNGKDKECVAYVDSLASDYGIGVKTLGTIYNATGDDLTYICCHDWHGSTYNKPYPMVIKNGQWGGFLHVHASKSTAGSCGAVVYRGLNQDDTVCDWALAWSVPFTTVFGGSNRVYSEIREKDHFQGDGTWWVVNNQLLEQGLNYNGTWNKCKCDEQIGSDTTSTFVAIMSIDDPNPAFLDA